MKRLTFLALVAGTILLAGCGGGGDDPDLVLTGSLSGANEVPANTATGTGTTRVTVNDDGTMRVQVNATGLSGVAAGAHIHVGVAGANGSVVTDLLTGGSGTLTNTGGALTIDKTFPAPPAGLDSGTHYINVHTAAVPSGELRANLTDSG
jgi:ABC-type glycerol-3-phosphate transport system substrate-binding protein